MLLTVEDAKLECLNFAVIFTITDMFWVRKTRQMHVIRGYKKLGTAISFTLHSPSSFIHPCKTFIQPRVNHSPG